MNQRLIGLLRQATGTGFVAGVLLIALGLAGLSASPSLVAVLIVVGVAGTAVRGTLRGLLDHRAFAAYLASVPIAPLLAGVVLLAFTGASPGELQTLGGVLGLLAICNHMLRPVYALGHSLLARLARTLA